MENLLEHLLERNFRMRRPRESNSDLRERTDDDLNVSRAAKLIISVSAGLVPGQASGEHSRQWTLDAEEVGDIEVYLAAQGAAVAYMMHLQNPQVVNWVRMDWIWL